MAVTGAALAGGAQEREIPLIVVLDGPPALAGGAAQTRAAQMDLARARAAFSDAAKDAGLHVQERRAFSLTLNGLAVTAPEDERDRLAELPGVAAVHPDRGVKASLDVSVPLVGAPRVWERRDPADRPATGTGVDVAVLDTGVDATHPALDEGKVVDGHDFVNDDADPMDDSGHGTHVAGIVAANGEPTGVAPGASVVAYKVLDAFGRGTTEDLLAGLEAAVDPANPHRAEVINLSLSGGEPMDGPLTSAAQAAAEAGVVVVAAAGNDGPGERTVGAPGQAPGALTVGATISGLSVPSVRMVAPRQLALRSERWEYSANPPDGARELEVVDIGSGDFEGKDVRGKAVLVDFPGPDVPKALEAERRGAAALIVHQGGGGPVAAGKGGAAAAMGRRPGGGWPARPGLAPAAGALARAFPAGSGDDGRFDSLVAVLVDDDTTAALREALAGDPVRIALSGEDATDRVTDFSSRGPTVGFTLKPDLAAPGLEIRSSVPKALHAPGIVRFSGTSMATPHVAGSAALLRQLHPDWSAPEVKAALAGTAKPLTTPPLDSGAGRLDVPAAADAAVVADATAISFGLTGTEGRVQRTRTIEVVNVDDEAAGVRIAARAAGGGSAPVTVTPSTATLRPGERATFTVRLDAAAPPSAADVQGWLDVDVAGPASDLRVPYAVSARALHVQVTPDPADDRAEAFVATPVDLGGPPVVEVRGPDGIVQRVTARHDHDQWWRAELQGRREGIYRVRATAKAADPLGGATLSGATTFEVAEPDEDNGSRLTWRPIGPNSVAGEVDVGPGHRPHTYVLDPNQKMLWVSEDRAETWRARRITPFTQPTMVELVPDPARPGDLYVAVSWDPAEQTFEGRILRSRDDGRTWTSLPAPDIRLVDLEVAPGGRVLAAATEAGLYAGEDRGARWDPVAGPWSRINATHLAGDDLYLATDLGVWVIDRFARGGRTPRRVDAAGPTFVTDVVGDGRVIAAIAGGAVRGSRDGGRTWGSLFKPPDGGGVWALKVVGSTVYASTFDAFWVGEGEGTRWQRRSSPETDSVAMDVAPRPSGRGVLVSVHGSGLYATTDGARTYRRVGVPGVPVWDLAIAEGRHRRPWLVAGTRWSTYRTEVPGDDLEWGASGGEDQVGAAAQHVMTAPSRPRVVVRTIQTAIGEFFVERSDDAGETWRRIGQGKAAATALVVDPHDPDRIVVGFFAITGNGLLATVDGGKTWRRTRREAPPAALAADPRDGDRLWLADAQGLHRSTDGGAAFTTLHDEPLTSVQVSPRDSRHLIAGGQALFVSNDGGATLRRAAYADLPIEIADVLFDPERRGVVYAAAACSDGGGLPREGRGVLRSTDGGRSWSSFAEGLDTRCVRTLALDPDGRYLFAGTGGAGVQRIKLKRWWGW